MRGANEDNTISRFPNTRTLKCKNPFCGFTWAEDMDEVNLRVECITPECPKCGSSDYEIVNYEFKKVVLGTQSD